MTGECFKNIIYVRVCVHLCVYVHRQVSWGEQSLCEYVAAFSQPQLSYRNPLHCANMEVHMNIPTQSLTLTHTLAHTHIFDRRTCCLVAHALSG